jgi:hypothetical protein
MNDRGIPPFPPKLAAHRVGRHAEAVLGGVAILVIYALVNAGIYPFLASISRSPVNRLILLVPAIALGVIASEIGTFSVALVFGAPNFLLRLIALWGAGLVLVACWAVSMQIVEHWRASGDGIRAVAFGLPLITLAVQAPLWMLKLYFGWRIEPADERVPTGNSKSLSIRDILTGTLVTALSIGAARFVVDSRNDLDLEFWAAWGIGVACLAAASLLVLAPLLMLILRVDRPAVAFGAAAGYAVAAGSIATGIWIAIEPGILNDGDFLMAPAVLISCALSVIAPFGIARLAGYRLRIGQGAATR